MTMHREDLLSVRPLVLPGSRRVYIETYGCQMNVNDSEVVLSILQGAGYTLCGEMGQADLILVNTCSVRDNAEQRVLGRLDVFRQEKKRRPTPADAAIDYVAYLLETENDNEQKDAPQMKGQDLIDTFLQQEQGRIMLSELPQDDSEDSQQDNNNDNDEEYFTETLARIYIRQGRYQKALDIISRLSSKYPQKNAYFADQIRFLEKLIINSNTKSKN